jgi:uncharacterized pyridoxamine 5'-phosphate oxidase family protein
MWMWFADETGFYFHTGTQKRLSGQLENNSNMEIAFFNPEDWQGGQMVRITGKVEMVEDEPLENKLFQERTWLNDIKVAYPNDRIIIFRVPHWHKAAVAVAAAIASLQRLKSTAHSNGITPAPIPISRNLFSWL